MSYSPFAVLGTAQLIQKNKDQLLKVAESDTVKEETEISYTQMFRETYFPQLAEKENEK